MIGRRGALIVVVVLLASAPGAQAAAPLGLESCTPTGGLEQCSGLVESWDGVPLDATVTRPAGADRPLPLVVEIHGFGNSKYEYLGPASRAYTDNVFGWARDGYAVLVYTARGLWGSCGTLEARLANPGPCARGYIHLADARYEVRDTQELIGRLVDERVADRSAIGVTGDSYGGGQSIALAALHDRVMLPSGELVPWRSPRGRPLRIGAAAPVIPWTDLPYAIAPNGSTLTYAVTPQSASSSPVGVEKLSFATGIFAAAQAATGPGQPIGRPFLPGRPSGYLAPPLLDPEADVTSWVGRASAGEPYTDSGARAIIDTLERFHSPYAIDPGRGPAPLFVASGFTDDLFPVDEALRFVNRTEARFPRTPVAALFGDFGHQRAANKPPDRARLVASIHGWFDHFLRGRGRGPGEGVRALTQTCPRSRPSRGPYRARSFAALAYGEVRERFAAAGEIHSLAGSPAIGAAIDPVTGGGNGCASTAAADQPGTATYRLPTVDRRFTLLGAPTLSARLALAGSPPGVAQIAGRLWDVGPDGERQTLVARGLFRPTGAGREIWQLHANGWRFERGHTPKLELLGSDPPFARPSNGPFTIAISGLEVRLPTRERPGSGAPVRRRLRAVLPPGQRGLRDPD